MRKPDFFIVGARKSGTTSLYAYLQEHPEIFMPHNKEPNFFGDIDFPYQRRLTLNEYAQLFAHVPDCIKAGEASATYIYSKTAASEIHAFNNDAKIIILLRDPIERAYSTYWHNRRCGFETLPFEDALDAEPDRGPWHHYVGAGMYAIQVERYLSLFGEESVRTYLFDDLRADAHALARDAFAFLGVDPDHEVSTAKQHNVGGMPRGRLGPFLWRNLFAKEYGVKALAKKLMPPRLRSAVRGRIEELVTERRTEPISPKTRDRLREAFRKDVQQLQSLIGRDLSHWLN